MTNLLPPDGKKRVAIDYWMRVAATYLTLVGVAMMIISALLLPTYFYISFQSFALVSDASDVAEGVQSFEALKREVARANDISALLIDTPDYIEASEVIDEILRFSGETISVENIAITKEGKMITGVVVGGTAADRAALVAFRDAAEANRLFAEVDLPLSNLAQDQNIPFSLVLEPSNELQTEL